MSGAISCACLSTWQTISAALCVQVTSLCERLAAMSASHSWRSLLTSHGVRGVLAASVSSSRWSLPSHDSFVRGCLLPASAIALPSAGPRPSSPATDLGDAGSGSLLSAQFWARRAMDRVSLQRSKVLTEDDRFGMARYPALSLTEASDRRARRDRHRRLAELVALGLHVELGSVFGVPASWTHGAHVDLSGGGDTDRGASASGDAGGDDDDIDEGTPAAVRGRDGAWFSTRRAAHHHIPFPRPMTVPSQMQTASQDAQLLKEGRRAASEIKRQLPRVKHRVEQWATTQPAVDSLHPSRRTGVAIRLSPSAALPVIDVDDFALFCPTLSEFRMLRLRMRGSGGSSPGSAGRAVEATAGRDGAGEARYDDTTAAVTAGAALAGASATSPTVPAVEVPGAAASLAPAPANGGAALGHAPSVGAGDAALGAAAAPASQSVGGAESTRDRAA